MADLRYDTVTLVSDYGHSDGTVGVVHSVIRQLAPGVGIVDLSHEVDPFDVRGASLLLARSVQYLCPGVILALVEPGAGAGTRPIAVEVADGAAVIMGPDNGVIAPAVSMVGGAGRAVVLDNADYLLPTAATTASGRDVFAAAAAHLCSGIAFEDLGTAIDPVMLLPGVVPLSTLEDGVLSGEVLWVDRFGNVQMNLDPDEIEGWGDVLQFDVTDARRSVRRITGFGELAVGELGLLVDEHGLLAVVTNGASASDELGLHAGDAVQLTVGDADGAPLAVPTSVRLGPTNR